MTTDLHSLMAPYALNALDSWERETFEAHLEQCDDCRAELAGFVATAARLGEAAKQAPPAELRDRLLAAAATTPQERPVVTALAQRRGLRRTLPRLAMAAAFLVGTVGVGGYVAERNQADNYRADSQTITSVLAAADAKTSIKTFGGGGKVQLISSASKNSAVIVASDLPTLKNSKVYQVWLVKDDSPTSQGTFASSGAMIMKGLVGVDHVAITVEPKGGSKQPTTAPISTIAV
jgi:anti-sigma-K factor RskA